MEKQKALFLDRDGVVNLMIKRFNKDKDKIIDDSPFSDSELEFMPNLKKLVNKARELGYKIIIITNQPSIIKGNFSMLEYEKITTKICKYMNLERSDIFTCFHKEGLSLPCNCRKPKPGLILMAKGLFDLDLNNSVLIGDSSTDLLAGNSAGVGKIIFFRRKNNERQIGNAEDEKNIKSLNITLDHIIEDLSEAIDLI